ncbi:MAG: right-handed parallel beta-helix repeat-containing protein [Verrucomicrobia bacterium]|nr:right-handed parallel beta-helix repeat-containing protein [Verrucomicrobiota bacterium]MCH8527120.1 right-handed parallel beta-helix repeat-containing protein [Kiritimatiellia bacterium]
MPALHISPSGDDRNSGSESAPLQSLSAARNRVREILQTRAPGTPKEDVVVKLTAGTHRLEETLTLGPEDCGNGTFQVIWEGSEDGGTLLSSGVPLTGWTRCENDLPDVPEDVRGKVWVAQLTPGTAVNTLYGPGGSIPRAKGKAVQPLRIPRPEAAERFGPDGPIPGEMWSDKPEGVWLHDRFRFAEGAITPAADLHEAEFLIIPAMQWTMNILPPADIDFTTRIVTLAKPCTYPIGVPHCAPEGSIWLENSLSVLSPGHWVYHADTAKLYYCPEGDKPDAELTAGSLVEYIRIEGLEERAVKGIRLRNLTFTHSNRYRFHGLTGRGIQHDWEMHDAATCMVRLRHAEDCSVEHCRFTEGGAGGVRLDLACRDNRVEDCEFARLGGCGIVLCGYGLGRKYLNRNNHILRNHLHHLGRAYWHCPGIFIWQSGENRVADNHIHDLPYTGIVCSGRTLFDRGGKGECSRTIDWDAVEAQCGKGYEHNVWYYGSLPSWWMREPLMHARDNLIEYNRIHDVMKVMGDGNGIYISGAGGGNVVRFNVVGPCPSPTMAEGIRCDDDQHHTILHGNLIFQQGGGATGITLKGVNRVTNNIIATSLTTPVRGFLSLETGPLNGSVIQRNILLTTAPDQRFVNDLRIHGQGRKARLRDTESDRNVYWCLGDPEAGPRFLATAQSFGTDTDSLAADPGFVAPGNGDFRLKPGAAALRTGFQPLPLERMFGTESNPL